ncbi:Esterase lipase [Mycena kentingensis (nom. inval.)]|nr:Esterase lipase [Mycena kentingensis (nom. inval.)]
MNHHLNIAFTTEADPLRSFDAYIPSFPSQAILVFVHGGAWRAGDKADYKNLAAKLVEASGCAVLVPNYRLTPASPSAGNKFEHPGHAEDILTFLTFLANWEGLAGLENISKLPVHAIGHSAGAHILASIFLDSSAVTPTLTPSAAVTQLVRGIVLSEGIYDIDLLLKSFPSYCDWFIAAAFGQHESYIDGSVSRLALRPGLEHLRWLVGHSSGDTLVDVVQSETMRDHLQALYGQSQVTSSFDAVAVEHDDVLLDPVFIELVAKFVGSA